jgi:23S rRNA (cytidine1920-2'-O)/16S rRNA (cytidine1409-2'-O)-methyltransferase
MNCSRRSRAASIAIGDVDPVDEASVPGGEPDAPARLDSALAERGLARSRTHAARLIADGVVRVDGASALRASQRVSAKSQIEVEAADHYVSRAAHKLLAGLEAFDVVATDRSALDVGASTGGFTQVLLERGARAVIALDVGHDQLATEIAADPRVTVIEGFNAREMSAASLAASGAALDGALPDLVVADLSFISLSLVLPALVATVGTSADFVLLVKPQFEVGRVREGVVRDAGLRADAVTGVLWSAWDVGLGTKGVISSPILGGAGNREYVVHLSGSGANPTEWLEHVSMLSR